MKDFYRFDVYDLGTKYTVKVTDVRDGSVSYVCEVDNPELGKAEGVHRLETRAIREIHPPGEMPA